MRGAFALFSLAVVAAFVVLEWRGVDLLPDTQRVVAPASVRGSPGAYRTYRSWGGGGFHGGK